MRRQFCFDERTLLCRNQGIDKMRPNPLLSALPTYYSQITNLGLFVCTVCVFGPTSYFIYSLKWKYSGLNVWPIRALQTQRPKETGKQALMERYRKKSRAFMHVVFVCIKPKPNRETQSTEAMIVSAWSRLDLNACSQHHPIPFQRLPESTHNEIRNNVTCRTTRQTFHNCGASKSGDHVFRELRIRFGNSSVLKGSVGYSLLFGYHCQHANSAWELLVRRAIFRPRGTRHYLSHYSILLNVPREPFVSPTGWFFFRSTSWHHGKNWNSCKKNIYWGTKVGWPIARQQFDIQIDEIIVSVSLSSSNVLTLE